MFSNVRSFAFILYSTDGLILSKDSFIIIIIIIIIIIKTIKQWLYEALFIVPCKMVRTLNRFVLQTQMWDPQDSLEGRKNTFLGQCCEFHVPEHCLYIWTNESQ